MLSYGKIEFCHKSSQYKLVWAVHADELSPQISPFPLGDQDNELSPQISLLPLGDQDNELTPATW